MFICLEGIDGAGKTTVAKMLTRRLMAVKHKVRFFEHNLARAELPYVNTQLQNLQTIQLQALGSPYEQVCELHWVLLRASYYAMVAEHVVAPALRAGEDVITDGWFYKFAARIASNGSMHIDDVMKYAKEVRSPDLVVLLDVDPCVAAKRKTGFNAGELGPKEMHSSWPSETFIRYQSLVRNNLRQVAVLSGWISINASTAPVGEIVSQIFGHYSSKAGRYPSTADEVSVPL